METKMTRGFRVSESLTLPRDSATWVFAFLAKRGAGKTYCAAVLAEEMLKQEIPIVVIDGMGIWWGLRVGSKGEGPGLPVVVFGGEHGDLSLSVNKSKQMARAIVDANISAVLDLSGLQRRQARMVVADFLDELYRLNRIERHVFIEEADMYAPQRIAGPEMAACFGAVDNFVRRGGNHNLGATLISQRSAVLNKDVLTQADCLVVLRTLAPQDKDAIQAWVEEMTDQDRRALNEWYDSLKSLRNGESWVWHPEHPPIFRRILFRERETFHATRKFLLSPQADKVRLMDVQEFIERFRAAFEAKETKPRETPMAEKIPHTPVPRVAEQVGTIPPQRPQPPEPLHERHVAVVQIQKPDVQLSVRKPVLHASDRDVLGRLLYAVKKGYFDQRQTVPKAVNILSQFGWLHTRQEVEDALVRLCDLKFMVRKKSTGNMFWYSLEPDARERIILSEEDSV
ncbi:MAG: hypothetical protein QXI19_13210 [Candidatus Caldarchaeum sp.]